MSALKVGDLVLWKSGLSRCDTYPELGVVVELSSRHPEWVARVSDTGDPDVWGWSAWVTDGEVEIVSDLSTVPTSRLVTSIGLGGTSHGPALLAEARRRRSAVSGGDETGGAS